MNRKGRYVSPWKRYIRCMLGILCSKTMYICKGCVNHFGRFMKTGFFWKIPESYFQTFLINYKCRVCWHVCFLLRVSLGIPELQGGEFMDLFKLIKGLRLWITRIWRTLISISLSHMSREIPVFWPDGGNWGIGFTPYWGSLSVFTTWRKLWKQIYGAENSGSS